MTTLEVLQKARELIADPEHWCQRSMAQKEDGRDCSFDSPEVHRLCAIGAISRSNIPWDESNQKALDLLKKIAPRHLANYNDDPGTTHANILYLYDQAIAMESKECSTT